MNNERVQMTTAMLNMAIALNRSKRYELYTADSSLPEESFLLEYGVIHMNLGRRISMTLAANALPGAVLILPGDSPPTFSLDASGARIEMNEYDRERDLSNIQTFLSGPTYKNICLSTSMEIQIDNYEELLADLSIFYKDRPLDVTFIII